MTLVAASFEAVDLLNTNVIVPRICVKCAADNPTKEYEAKAKALIGTEYALGGRSETWAAYSLKPQLCESCHKQLFRFTNLLMVAGGAFIVVDLAAIFGMALGPWSQTMDFSSELLLLIVAPMFIGLVLLVLGLCLRPPMPLTIETKEGVVRLVFENRAVAGAFLALNQRACGDVVTRAMRPRDWAAYGVPASILALICLEAVQIPYWGQRVQNPEFLPTVLILFGSMIAFGLAATSAAVVYSRKPSNMPQARRLVLFGGLWSIGWLLFLDLVINSARTSSMNPFPVLLGAAGVAAVYYSFETSETIAQPPPDAT